MGVLVEVLPQPLECFEVLPRDGSALCARRYPAKAAAATRQYLLRSAPRLPIVLISFSCCSMAPLRGPHIGCWQGRKVWYIREGAERCMGGGPTLREGASAATPMRDSDFLRSIGGRTPSSSNMDRDR